MVNGKGLDFLTGRKCVYYAGLDHDSLPFSEGEKQISNTANDQILYLKALSLISDYIIIPPSFFFFWSSVHRNNNHLNEILELFQANIILSPIYTSMNMGTDFLEYKQWLGSVQDKYIIQDNISLLVPFYKNMPVFHRNVHIQSGGFRRSLVDEFNIIRGSSIATKRFSKLFLEPRDTEVQASRAQIYRELWYSLNYEDLNKHTYRRYYYATNRSYYKQGALTYDAVISLVGAERYSVLGKELFSKENGVLIAYDPLVLIGILDLMGISKPLINDLSIKNIIEIRNSNAFPVFRDAYFSFALTLQQIAISTKRISKNLILNSKNQFTKSFLNRYFREESNYSNLTKKWNFSEMTTLALALGAAGFIVMPIIGAILGLAPVLVYRLGLTTRLSEYVIEKFSEKEIPFLLFISELKKIVYESTKTDLTSRDQ